MVCALHLRTSESTVGSRKTVLETRALPAGKIQSWLDEEIRLTITGRAQAPDFSRGVSEPLQLKCLAHTGSAGPNETNPEGTVGSDVVEMTEDSNKAPNRKMGGEGSSKQRHREYGCSLRRVRCQADGLAYASTLGWMRVEPQQRNAHPSEEDRSGSMNLPTSVEERINESSR